MSEELFTVEVRVNRCNFEKETFRIFSCIPLDRSKCPFRLSEYGTFSLKGDLPYIDVGKEYTMILREMSRDARYGSCCEVYDVPSLSDFDVHNLPREEAFDILRNCSTTSDRLANNILDAYPNFIEIILTEGQEAIDLKKIKGVGESYLNSYSRKLLERYKYYGMVKRFKAYGITMKDCKKLIERYGDEETLATQFEKDPYHVLILDLEQSYKKADANILEVRPELQKSKLRCSYFVHSILLINEEYGNTRLSGADLYNYAVNEYNNPEFFEKDEDDVELIVKVIKESELFYYDEETTDVSIATTYDAECQLTDLIYGLVENPKLVAIDTSVFTDIDGFKLSAKQSSALDMFCKTNFMVLCGYSGGGKTSTIKGFIKMIEALGMTYTLLAPTGKSSMRVSESVHRPASTIHRKVLRDEEISTDVIIVDEMSMPDVKTIMMLVNAITNKETVKIVFVGDNAQLSPIGVGCVFDDIINSGVVPMVMLDEVFRYKTNGGLFVATNVRQGISFFNDTDMVKHVDNEYRVCNNYKFIETENIFDEVVEQYRALINKGVKKNEILCLSPMNVGNEGSYKINNRLQAEFNPPRPHEITMSRTIKNSKYDDVNVTFRVGDLIINKKNDYKAIPYDSYMEWKNAHGEIELQDTKPTALFNGQVGVVREIRYEDNVLIAQFEEELIVLNDDKLKNVLLAYCISIHSSQGSEAKYVINVISDKHKHMLNRNMLYVADTRGKELTIDVGSKEAYNEALKVDGVSQRFTWLKELLIKKFEEEG